MNNLLLVKVLVSKGTPEKDAYKIIRLRNQIKNKTFNFKD